jgi:hypothetical protein
MWNIILQQPGPLQAVFAPGAAGSHPLVKCVVQEYDCTLLYASRDCWVS